MKFTGVTYRPPQEASTQLLQVTNGCAYNKCKYCTMYKTQKFCVEKISQIEKDILELKKQHENLERIFLVNGDAFVLSARRLIEISNLLHVHFKMLKTITMYASVSNIKNKSDDDLEKLKSVGINELWIGVETGHDQTLDFMEKGHTKLDAIKTLSRLSIAGIKHFDGIMLGIAGHKKGADNAKQTADLLNKTKPDIIKVCTTSIMPDSELSMLVKQGKFQAATEFEVIKEHIKLLENLTLKNTYYYSTHPSNTVKFAGVLPEDKNKMIQLLGKRLTEIDRSVLNQSMARTKL